MTTQSNGHTVLQESRTAFKLIDDATAFKGAANQAMAWVLRTVHAEFVANGMTLPPGKKETQASKGHRVATWAEIRKGGECAKDFKRAVAYYVGITTAQAGKGETYKQRDARQTANNTERRHERLIASSIPFAAALDARNVPMENYGEVTINARKLPAWRVPVKTLAMPGWTLLGDDAVNPDNLRALDGKSLLAQRKNDNGDWVAASNAVASVDQFVRAIFGEDKSESTAAPSPQAPQPDEPVKLDNGKEVPGDFNKLVLAAAKLINEVTDKGDATVPLSAFDQPMRHALAALAAFYAEAVAADAPVAPAQAEGVTLHMLT